MAVRRRPFQPRRLERQESLDGQADVFGPARHVMLERALVGEAALQAAEFAKMVRAQRCLEIGVALEVAFEEGPFVAAGR